MATPLSLRKRGMPGGLKLEPHKRSSTERPIEVMPRPEFLVLPLRQHTGVPAEPIVAIGDRVARGQMLAHAIGSISAAIHAPASGVVTAIEARPWPHPSGQSAICIVIRTDADGSNEGAMAPMTAWHSASPDILRERIREAGIVGLGGAGFPTHIKLSPGPAHAVQLLILNGAECEPYISCDDMLMRERATEIVNGAGIMLRVLGAEHCIIALEEDKPEAYEALVRAVASRPEGRMEIRTVPARYPQGGERQLIQTLTGRQVPNGGLPLHIGMVCHNVGTAASVHHAVIGGQPLASRIVTVTGPGVAAPRNVEALLGTPVSELIAACGGYTVDQPVLTMGGPMMGFALVNDQVPVVKAMNCLLVRAPEVVPDAQPCIRCTECAIVCPELLLPQQLHWHTLAGDFEQAIEHGLFDCIECGCCDAVCPSHIPLVSEFRWAKGEIAHREEEARKADISKRRFEARKERLASEQRERDERLKRKQDPAAIEAALARIKESK